VGCFIALIGLFVLAASTWISVAGVHRLSPRTFPYVVGLLMSVCGAVLATRSWRMRGSEDRPIAWPDEQGFWIIAVALVSLAAYIALLNPLGLPLATFLYTAFSIWYLKPSRWWLALSIGLIVGVSSYVVFIRLLGLSFPAGFFLEG
jgi:putative tricarboxylic transport membrane protein